MFTHDGHESHVMTHKIELRNLKSIEIFMGNKLWKEIHYDFL